ncbi:NAD-dependent epimerase/dehydratase family protein [Brachybacterium phenoliresistens]|uniref:Saccharopine dehydrogenase n=1 Tax=Brachybacterium phenoliresistens TaxID=396014 RepID=Z9JVA7_9MICO|nr:NAD-dependent epimerase/dehydratase family protein [Brachybacterium phenoliresistens]EWS81707.1 saccharopine dehydrogenase [Brachybacterium phenoliresistens]
MRALVLGARGAVGQVVRRELTRQGHTVTGASRHADADAVVDLRGDLAALSRLSRSHDVVVNAAGIERAELAAAVGGTPLVEISATGAYLEELRTAASGAVVLGAGLVPGLSTVLVSSLEPRPGDDVDVLLMLGSGEAHGPAAVAWTASLVGADVHRPPEGRPVRNLRSSTRAVGRDGRSRHYLRADFPDHVLLRAQRGIDVRSYLALSSPALTAALGAVGRIPRLRGLLRAVPHAGSDRWHVLVRNRRTGATLQVDGVGQSEATGRLTALAAQHAATSPRRGSMTMADLIDLEEAQAALGR